MTAAVKAVKSTRLANAANVSSSNETSIKNIKNRVKTALITGPNINTNTNNSQSSNQNVNTVIISKIPLDATIKTNPYLNDFIDCIQNLPNKLQLLLSELRNIDCQVKCKFFFRVYKTNLIWLLINFS
jgi:hypothetical protein